MPGYYNSVICFYLYWFLFSKFTLSVNTSKNLIKETWPSPEILLTLFSSVCCRKPVLLHAGSFSQYMLEALDQLSLILVPLETGCGQLPLGKRETS